MNEVLDVVYCIIIGIAVGQAAVGIEVHFSVQRADAAAFNLEQGRVLAAFNPEGQVGIIFQRTVSAFDVVNYNCAGVFNGITAEGNVYPAVMVVKALM